MSHFPMLERPETSSIGKVNLLVTAKLIVCMLLVLIGSARKWIQLLSVRAPVGVEVR